MKEKVDIRTHNLPEYCERRRKLRTNGTSAEAVMWRMLKSRPVQGVKFRRQFSVGPYVLDFYSPELKLCIELDGSPHYTRDGYENDQRRSEYLESMHGIRILRFENKNVFKFANGVISEIVNVVKELRSLKK